MRNLTCEIVIFLDLSTNFEKSVAFPYSGSCDTSRGQSLCSDNCKDQGAYIAPNMNIPVTATLRPNGICSLQITVHGMDRTKKSRMTEMIA
jgi:hypothetical protein